MRTAGRSQSTFRVTNLALPLGMMLGASIPPSAWALAAQTAPAQSKRSASSSLNELRSLRVEEVTDGTTTLRLTGTGEPTFNVYRLADPERVVVDIAGSRPKGIVPRATVDNWAVGRVTIDAVHEQGADVSRVVVELKRDASYIIVPTGKDLLVTITPRDLPPEAYFERQSAAQRKQAIERKEKSANATAKQAKASARKANAQAKAAAREAKRAEERASDSERRVREAESRRVAALEERARIEEQAKSTREQAEALLARAERAEREARAEHERALEARGEAEKARASAISRAKADEAASDAAKRARQREKQALARAEAAEAKLFQLAKNRAALSGTLERQAKESAELEASLGKRRAQLQSLTSEVSSAQDKLDRLGGAVSKSDIEAARQEAGRAEARRAVLAKEVERLEAEVGDTKRSRGEKAERELARRQRTLATVEREVETKRAEILEMEANRAALNHQSTGLKRDNKAARTELAAAKRELARVEKTIERESTRLAALNGKVTDARGKLEGSLGETKADKPATLKKTRAPQAKADSKSKVRLTDVRFEDAPSESRVIVELSAPGKYTVKNLTPWMKSLRIQGATLPRALERNLDTSAYQSPVAMITTVRDGGDVKLIVTSQHGVAAEVTEQPGRLVWTFPRKHQRGRAEAVSLSGSKVSGFAAPPQGANTTTSKYTRGGNKWRGERIDIEFQDASIKDILLMFSDIAHVNIIAGTGVAGTVSMRLKAVPWDQALDIVLRSLSLGMVQEGNVIRVASIAALEEERKKAIERANAQVRLKPLETRLIPLSYATVNDMMPKVQSVLSSRGTVTPDSRTNTLIVMDVAENIALAEQLINQLDGQTPQVVIEARIVEARTSWLRQLGIQWGFDYIASAGTGNPTGLLFPNSVGVAGGSGSTGGATPGFILPHAAASPNYAVDLPAPVGTGAGGAIGFSFGSISGNLNTNLRLSAAEDVGEVRIISAPQIVAMDNVQAQIEQGVQIPVSQVSAQGVNTRYVNATLALRVTPHVTNEGSVVLEVQVQKNEADFINTGARGDPTILTKQAQSRMLISDGDTAVIGGINTRNTSINRKKVPWIADIPIIGWFFKNKSEADTRTEVLIFLTPKIVNRSTSIGG